MFLCFCIVHAAVDSTDGELVVGTCQFANKCSNAPKKGQKGKYCKQVNLDIDNKGF